ncbi:MAG: DUF2304 domain-containing protein, partial [Bifidobacteriaceae bacterium]|nr:DUF2304 domain-containing protein [Bifidobacteriaceae bacterium]
MIKALLIAAVLLIGAAAIRGQGARRQALRRIGLVAFAGFAVVSILQPDLLTAAARLLNVGRGADLLLYALIVVFLAYVATRHVRDARMADKITALARQVALNQAPPPRAVDRAGGDGGGGGTGPGAGGDPGGGKRATRRLDGGDAGWPWRVRWHAHLTTVSPRWPVCRVEGGVARTCRLSMSVVRVACPRRVCAWRLRRHHFSDANSGRPPRPRPPAAGVGRRETVLGRLPRRHDSTAGHFRRPAAHPPSRHRPP